MAEKQRVVVIGLWHQGIVAASVLADQGFIVNAMDEDPATINSLNNAKAPIFEPGLDDLIANGLANSSLKFSGMKTKPVEQADFIVIAHDTPVDEEDKSDIGPILEAVDWMIPKLREGVTIHVTAQVPVGTCDKISESIRKKRDKLEFGLAYSPENLRLGEALQRYENPNLPVIGTDDTEVFDRLVKFYSWTGVEWSRCSLKTGEMLKHSLNSYMALSISFANEIGNLCDKIGADGQMLGQLLKLEPRISRHALLSPGLGFSGGTLARDVQTLRRLGQTKNVPTFLQDAVWHANQMQNSMVVSLLRDYFGGSFVGKKVCVLGITYKPNTSTLRRSAAVEICNEINRGGGIVQAHDPMVDRDELQSVKSINFYEDLYGSLTGVDATVVITAWKQFKQLDLNIVKNMTVGRLFMDTTNLFRQEDVEAAGLQYAAIGRGLIFGERG